jgi:hypothetical protein
MDRLFRELSATLSGSGCEGTSIRTGQSALLRYCVLMWSALTCQRFGMRRLVAAEVTDGRDKSRPRKAATSRRTPHFVLRMWSALTCQRFGIRRLVAAVIHGWPRQVAA